MFEVVAPIQVSGFVGCLTPDNFIEHQPGKSVSVSRSRHLGCTCETHEFWRPARRAIKDDYAGQVHIEAMTVEPEPQCAAAELAIVEETPVEALAGDSATLAVEEETAATARDDARSGRRRRRCSRRRRPP